MSFSGSVNAAIPTDYKKVSYSAVVGASGIHDVFPKDYWPQLDALAAKYPNWQFQALYTGLKWNDCFSGTFHQNDPGNSELYFRRNLIEKVDAKSEWYYAPSSWFSTSIEGAFNWAKNSYYVVETPNFIQASEEAIKYCMDVRNWIGSEEQIFQFEDQTNHIASTNDEQLTLNVFLNASWAPFWQKSAEETGIVNDQGKKLTYAQAITEICHNLGLNPVSVASRILQEQGSGDNGFLSGTQRFTLTAGEHAGQTVDGGYYNYFNMGSTGNTQTERYNNGLTEAYLAGWNSRYKALYGGAKKLKDNYAARKQTNVYLQKFNVISDSSYCLWGQYMGAILAPQSEAKKAYSSYVAGNDLASAHRFLIPVFLEYPSTPAPRPTVDGNPNYKIGSIYVDGKSVPNFDTDTLTYDLGSVKNDVTTIRLNVHAYAPTSTVTVENVTRNQDLAESFNVFPGDNTYKVICKAENGSSRTYTLKLHRDGEVIYGDINADGSWDSLDLAYMTSHLLKKNILTGNAYESADISGDGMVDSLDLAYLTALLLGRISKLPR